ncbi:hypothetical protein [Aliiglaciecola sp. M165]|uniref:hypothetical protein n=1 Tax=Aliiglaciecola sp. M165 TaxID=2593649 RepID=UPI00117DCFAE|nr:hypothetical protein [Aliiglaciecola sp. M165]TRY29771.1 hypothetical protein FM019_16500 [Aliiglaciecola sp. M165]
MKLYNGITNQFVLNMRSELLRYYELSFERLSQGDFFIPEGIVKTSFERIVLQLTSHLIEAKHRFDLGCPASVNDIKRLHFGMLHREVHVAKIDWFIPHYVLNFRNTELEPMVFRVVSIDAIKRAHRKIWIALLVDGTRYDLRGGASVYRAIKTYPKALQSEAQFPPKHVPPNWRLLVKQGINNVNTPSYWELRVDEGENYSAQILDFSQTGKS